MIEKTKGVWLDAGKVDPLNLAADSMRRVVPEKGTSLLNAFKAIGEMKPAPDNIFFHGQQQALANQSIQQKTSPFI
ncbi:MAG: hypothetical protein JRF31_07090 [Deltaproteobacteria bacterium]|nr:hypothetical protein [Deltaproteobacteria bacterium]